MTFETSGYQLLPVLPELVLAAGSMVVYPSTSLHHVTPVTRGERVSSFFWLQSMVRNDGKRSMLFDLDQSIQMLEPGSAPAVKLTSIYHNLLREWVEM